MLKKDTETLRRYLLISLIILAALIIAILLHRFGPPLLGDTLGFIFIALSPFVLAWVAAVFMRPMINALRRYLHFPHTLAVLSVMLFCLGLLGIIGMALVLVVVDVVGDLRLYFGDPENSVMAMFSRLQIIYHQLDMNFEQLQQWLTQIYENAGELASQGVGMAFNILRGAPTLLLLIVVTLVAIFYWCHDEETVKRLIAAPLPIRKRQYALEIYDSVSKVIGNYLRAQVLLVSVSILVCIVGLTLLRAPSAFAIGLLAGVLDLIPVLGPGTILVPWGLWQLLTGQIFRGVGLLALFCAVILIRNLVQPKIIGDQMGLHPLITLAALFIGMKVLGVIGLLMGPLVAALAVALVRAYRKRPPQA